mmetsp:Transcript_70520/g.110358  ORF Transcript_70520/g.110358 Transcript_70520/m.110358 type:complete len:97 (+) Transcript_70520:285-575(+)
MGTAALSTLGGTGESPNSLGVGDEFEFADPIADVDADDRIAPDVEDDCPRDDTAFIEARVPKLRVDLLAACERVSSSMVDRCVAALVKKRKMEPRE